MSALQNLRLSPLPHAFVSDEDSDRSLELQEWKVNVFNTVTKLREIVAHNKECLTDSEFASVIAVAVPVSGDDSLASGPTRIIAKDVLSQLPSTTLEVVTCVLSQHIKPWFLKTPHSLINPVSGRRLSRPAGGPSAAQDFYEDQGWKTFPGLASLLLWCIRHLKTEDYEQVWHLVIPPIMTLLDDYESYYKLQGVTVVSEFLQHVPAETLKRTGVDGLLFTSLRATMVHLHSPLTPNILRNSIPLLLRVIVLTTRAGSKARFDQLCTLLGDGIIGEIWLYASAEWETLEASVVVLPAVLRELGIGSVRFLKAIVGQLVHNLVSLPSRADCASLQLASLGVLEVIIDICQPRMNNWTGLIVEGLAKIWTTLQDDSTLPRRIELESALRHITLVLSRACPSVVENEYRRLLNCEKAMFQDLVQVDAL